MKKAALKKILLILPLCALLALSGCGYSDRLWEYYSNKENYVDASGTITYLNLDLIDSIYMSFSKSDLKPKFSDRAFEIVGKNLSLVLQRDLDRVLRVGGYVEFVSATGYFGDGYVMPIVSITVNGVEYLSFEEGYENYLEWLKAQKYEFF